jgi:hypothetical protein
MKNLLIRNISIEDHLLVEAAHRLGWTVFATSSSDDPKEFDLLQQHFKSLTIEKRPTSFQSHVPAKQFRLDSNHWIKKFCRRNNIKTHLRTARYTQTDDFNLRISRYGSFLERFFPSYGLHWNKALYLKHLLKLGMAVPEIYQVVQDQDEPNLDDGSIQYPCICKPAYCFGGLGVMVANSKSDILRLFAFEKNPDNFSAVNLYYRNRTSRGLRNYLHNSGHFQGPYLFQEYVSGRVFSVSGSIVHNQIQDFFSYEIHSAENEFCAEQAFSWPPPTGLEEQLKEQAQLMIKHLNYPSGSFMADFVWNKNGKLMLIDAAPRTSLTAVKMSHWVRNNNSHAISIVGAHSNEVYCEDASSSANRPVYWQRFPFPKGKIKFISYPDFQDQNILFVETPLQVGQHIHEMRSDRQVAERGSLAMTGVSLNDCHSNWKKWYREIQLSLE